MFDLPHLQAIHRHLFGDLYEWAGHLRTVDLTKDTSHFAHHAHLERAAAPIFLELAQEHHLRGLEPAAFSRSAAHYLAELNALHPFRDGNGRALRAFLSQIAHDSGYTIVWKHMTQADLLEASRRSFSGDLAPLTTLIQRHLHRGVPLHAPPLTPPSDADLQYLAEQERKRVQVIRTPTVRRFEPRDEGRVQFGSVEQIEGKHFALVHRQDETVVLSIDEATFKQLASVKRGHSIQISPTGSIRLGRGRKR